MVSKNQIKRITSLQQKKYRKQHKIFIAEGVKVIQELIDAKMQSANLKSRLQEQQNKVIKMKKK